MRLKTVYISAGIILLSLFLWFGSPLEFRNPIQNRIAIMISGTLIIFVFILLAKSINKLVNKIHRTIGIGAISILALAYSILGIMNIPGAISGTTPPWQDLFVYINDSGEKVYAQYADYHSVHDLRFMKTYHEFDNGNRISLVIYDFEPDETWQEIDLRSHLPK